MDKALLSKPFDTHTQICNTFIFETSQNNNSIITVQLQEIFCVMEQNVWRTVISVFYKCLYCVIMENTIMVTCITMTVYKSVINRTFVSQGIYQLYHTSCRQCLVGSSQSNCNKLTCLQALSATVFSAILLGCELCQAVQVHKRYRDRLWLYRQCSDVTEYTAFLNYTQRQGLKL